jgi:hypothetical protein
MQVEVARARFCQSARYAHAEVNRALYHDWTMAEFVNHHIATRNFRPEFTHKYVTLGVVEKGEAAPRYHHDVCHALLAMAYKMLGVDSTQFQFWTNGNEYAEVMAVPMENVFYYLVDFRALPLTEEMYVQSVKARFTDQKWKKERLRQVMVCDVAHVSPHPKTAFEICREGHFEMDYIAKLTPITPEQDDDNDLFAPSPISSTIRLPFTIDEDHVRKTYRALEPVFDYLERLLEPSVLTPYKHRELPRMHETLKSLKIRDLWEVMTGEPYVRPTIKPTPSL